MNRFHAADALPSYYEVPACPGGPILTLTGSLPRLTLNAQSPANPNTTWTSHLNVFMDPAASEGSFRALFINAGGSSSNKNMFRMSTWWANHLSMRFNAIVVVLVDAFASPPIITWIIVSPDPSELHHAFTKHVFLANAPSNDSLVPLYQVSNVLPLTISVNAEPYQHEDTAQLHQARWAMCHRASWDHEWVSGDFVWDARFTRVVEFEQTVGVGEIFLPRSYADDTVGSYDCEQNLQFAG
ncbi:hypothetical protein BJ742DRAFT_881346 [Cladochytrium replicatum]|nr:hypothetical protein BJ742DRAFT_881346 [Cladochytrium replicatum]